MADVKWIKIVTDIFDDEKILLIESLPEHDAIIVIWFKLLCLAGKMNNSGVLVMNNKIAYTEEMLATIFRRPLNTVRLALKTFEDFGMIERIDNVITIPNWSKHQTLDQLEERKEYMRDYMKKYREKQKQLACKTNSKVNSKSNSKVNVNSLEGEEERDKEDIDINNVQEKHTEKVSKAEITEFFERIWKLYPLKRGKGQVSDTQKKKLYGIGYDQLSIAIERYKDELKKDDWRTQQNGSTFFNSGYVDYLDGNYQPSDNTAKPKGTNKFNQFPQRKYSQEQMSEINRKLLNKALGGKS